ncbi:hypothetical protein ASG35_12295 [Burkholderia sp. Leaf177]|nr:hypothetical protein ASG35_12295 [Burkholderia sp. Leaf177]
MEYRSGLVFWPSLANEHQRSGVVFAHLHCHQMTQDAVNQLEATELRRRILARFTDKRVK